MDTEIESTASGRRWAYAAIGGLVVYVAVDVVLAFLRRDYSLLANAESDYGRGRDFWLMDANFILRGLVAFMVLIALSTLSSPPARWSRVLIGGWGACSALLAFFADNPSGYRHLPSGKVHLVLAALAFTASTIASVAITVQLRASPAMRSVAPILLTLAIVGVLSYLALPKAMGHPHGIGGLVERIFLGSQLLWQLVAMTALVRPRVAAAVS